MEYEVSLIADGENSGGIIERIVFVCNPHNSLFSNLVIINSNVRAEKSKCEGFFGLRVEFDRP